MNLQRLLITDLKPAPYNPREPLHPGDPAWDKLKRSLDEFELVQPIVWNRRTGHIVAGHQRLEILKADGHTEVDCVIVDLPPEREKALNVTLNNPSVASDWDPGKLVDLLDELQERPDFDATLTGFDAGQLDDILLRPAPPPIGAACSEPDESPSTVTATLEIPYVRWATVRGWLDGFLAQETDVRLHVRLPK